MNTKNNVQSGGLLKSTILWVYILLLFFITGSYSLVEGTQLSVPSARITLINLERGHLRTITEKVNHEVVLTVNTRYFEAYFFECNASYPVEWNYLGEAAPTTTADVGRHFKDFYDVNSYTYQSILYMYQLEELQSGRYICRGSNPEHEKLQIHYDLFVPGNGSRMLISTTEKEVFVSESKHLAALPCEVTNPQTTLSLFKGNSWGTFQKLELNQSIIFRPRKGFILKMQELPDPFGTYMCTTENNKRRRKVHLIPDRLKSKYENSNPLNGKIPVHLSYDYEYNRVLCCTGSSFVPKLQWAGCGSVLDCKIKSVCFEEDRCEPRMGHSGETKVVDPGPLPPGCAGLKLRDDPNGDYGIFKCSTPGVSQYQPYLLNRGNIFLDFDKAPASEAILTLTKTSSEPIFVGSEVEYHCNSTRFYFGFGIRWAFQRGNGDIEFVDDSSVLKDRYFLTAHTRQTTFRITHADINGIICFVPIANSATEWRTVSLPISVREAQYKIPPLASHHGQGSLHLQDYITNNIPYSSQPIQPHIVEPYSTSKPKGYYSYNTDVDPTAVSNIDISDIISFKEKPNRLPEIPKLSEISEILHDAQDRDYNTNFDSRKTGSNTFKFPSEEIPSRRVNPEYSGNLTPPDYQTDRDKTVDPYSTLQTHNYEPLYSTGSRIVNNLGQSSRIQPTSYAQPPSISNESQDIRNYSPRHKQHKSKGGSNNYEKYPFGTVEQLRNEYFTSTQRPSGYFDAYVAKINANKNSLETFSVKTTPTPELQVQQQTEIHYDTDYNQNPPRSQKIFNKIPTGLPPLNQREQLAPTLPSHHNTDEYYATSGSRVASESILPPLENSAPLPYSDDYYRSALRIQKSRNGLQQQQTTISPFYFNIKEESEGQQKQRPQTTISPAYQALERQKEYHKIFHQQKQPPPSSSHQQSSWEKQPSSSGVKESYEYNREPQQQEQQYYQSQRASSRADQNYDAASSGDENYYYQRYAAESTEFPAARKSLHLNSHIRNRPTLHNLPTYTEERNNNIRRNGYASEGDGENVPLVELG